MKINLFDTIANIATPIGTAGVSIIRISGDNSIKILKKIFVCNKDVFEIKTHTINYGHIYDKDKLIDEVLVSIMKAPKTYTKQDIVEINCHGGIKVTNKVLELVIKNGARLSENGEFTKRAFLNGRIDLSKAEGIIDVINAKTDLAHEYAIKRLQGNLSNKINNMKDILISLIAQIEASIDYPEYDMEHDNYNLISKKIKILKNDIDILIKNYDKGKLVTSGIETVILGKPNVGKSSLLNTLVGEEKAIVTNIEGTTRDALVEYINMDGILLKLVDTAGIRKTENKIEKIGIKKSIEYINSANLCLFILDNNKKLDNEDFEIFQLIKNKPHIIIINKVDLESKINFDEVKKYINIEDIIEISAKKNIGLKYLYNNIRKKFINENIKNDDEIYIQNRHKECLINTNSSLQKVVDGIKLNLPEDLLVIDLTDSYNYLLEITGENLDDDIINKIFSEFCLGK